MSQINQVIKSLSNDKFTIAAKEQNEDSLELLISSKDFNLVRLKIHNEDVPELDGWLLDNEKLHFYFSSTSQADFREYLQALRTDLILMASDNSFDVMEYRTFLGNKRSVLKLSFKPVCSSFEQLTKIPFASKKI